MLNVSFHNPFKLISILPGPEYRLVLGDAMLMSEVQNEAYEMLEEELGEEWEKLVGGSSEQRVCNIGDHVLVRPGFKRGIVHDRVECVPGTGQYLYSVFLYDHGIMEDVEDEFVVSLDLIPEDIRNSLPPRAVILTPVRLSNVPDFVSEGHIELSNVALFMEALPMSKKIKQSVQTWLSGKEVRSLRIRLAVDNQDFTVLGDIVRETFSDEPSSSSAIPVKNENLCDWLIERRFTNLKMLDYFNEVVAFEMEKDTAGDMSDEDDVASCDFDFCS